MEKHLSNNSNSQGIVYVLSNPSMPDIVKIGITVKKDIQGRMKELYGTGVALPFNCEYACQVDSADCQKIEKALHEAFAPDRVNPKREFFRILPEQAIAILKIIGQNCIDFTNEMNDDINNTLNPEDRSAAENERKRRPNFNFEIMNIPVGSKLIFSLDENIIIEVVANNKVKMGEDEISLSSATCQLLGKDSHYGVVPTSYWKYKGKLLRDIYNDIY